MSSADAYRHRLTALSVCYEANAPVLIWGPPGEGKNAALTAFAASRNVHCEVIVPSLRDPSDINGLPVTQADGTVRIAPPAWLTATNAQENSLLVIDELSTAPPATRAACLRVVNERVSADTPLRESTRIVAITNPPEVAEDGWDIGAPMSNRFCHLRDWQLPVETFTAGLTSNTWDVVPVLEIDTNALAAETARVAAAIAGFLRYDPSLLSRIPTLPSERQYAWPSPRSWTMCARLLAYAKAGRLHGQPLGDDVIALLAEGTVGPVAAPQLLAFLGALDMPEPEQLLADPSVWDVPDRGDLTWATLSRLQAHVIALSDDADRAVWSAAGRVIAHAAAVQGDVAVAAAADWWEHARVFGPGVVPTELAQGRFPNVFNLART